MKSTFLNFSVFSPILLAAFLFTPVPAMSATPALDSEQWAFLAAINDFRAQNGAGPLQVSAALQNASQWMSEDMASKLYFSHTDSLGRDPFVRAAVFGYPSLWGENIAAGHGDAQGVFTQWANSSGHRANMLNASFKAIGIGRAYNPGSPYGWYWTTDFGAVVDSVVTPGGGGGAPPPPVILSFTANPQNITAGQPVTLSWNVSGATSATINNGVGGVLGLTATVVFPSQTTTYTLTAANSTGSITSNVTIAVTPAPLVDSQAPTVPAIVSIAAKSATQVDLAWTASTDNVGVAGYQVLRNGSPIMTVPGSMLSYSDAGVTGNTTYSYAVRAFDAANNYSLQGNAAFVTTPAPLVAPGTSCPAAGNGAFTGCYYNNIGLTGSPAYVRTDSQINFDWGAGSPNPAVANSGYSVRWQGNLPFDGGDYTFTATTSDGIRVYIDGGLPLDEWRDQGPAVYTFRQSLTQGTHQITVEYYTRTGTSSAHLSWQVNPSVTRRGQAAPSISFFTATPGAVSAGQPATLSWSVGGATSIVVDNGIGDVTNVTAKSVSPSQTTTYKLTAVNAAGSAAAIVTVVVNAPQVDSQPPSAPTLTAAAAKSAGEVDLSWTASTDNVGVTGYRILRNGSVLTTAPAGTLSYADVSVVESTAYAYAIQALDAAGNVSQQSNSLTATTPAGSGSNVCGTPAVNAFTACYYNNLTLGGTPALMRTDNQINFDWTNGTPDNLVTPRNFSVRWQGRFDFAQGDYTFTALTSDGMRVYIDGALVLDSWREQPANLYTVMRALNAGSHLVTVEYYLRTGAGAAHLTWQGAGRGQR